MSRASRRRGARAGRPSQGGRNWQPFAIIATSVVAALFIVALSARDSGQRSHHPTPRALAKSSDVMPAARYAEFPRVQESYRLAASYPAVLDGIYCYCQCSQHSGHYSLLDCFASDHAARCDICMSEAVMAAQMSRDGSQLPEIRAEIDRTYSS